MVLVKIRLLSAGNAPDKLNIALRARLTAVFGPYSDSPCEIAHFSDYGALLSALAVSLDRNELTVVFVGASEGDEIKRSLLRSLHVKCELNLDVLERLPSELSAVEKEMHAMFPVDSEVFPTKDGRYSAFCCRAGENRLLFFPLYADFIRLAERQIACLLPRILTVPSDAGEPYIRLFRSVAKALYDRNVTVAVADTPTADFVKRPAALSGRIAHSFKFATESAVRRDDETPHEHTAAAAVAAATACNTPLGLAMSNIYVLRKNGIEQYVVYIAASINNRANVSRVYAEGEPVREFLKRAACELFSLLLCSVDGLGEATEDDGFDVF